MCRVLRTQLGKVREFLSLLGIHVWDAETDINKQYQVLINPVINNKAGYETEDFWGGNICATIWMKQEFEAGEYLKAKHARQREKQVQKPQDTASKPVSLE